MCSLLRRLAVLAPLVLTVPPITSRLAAEPPENLIDQARRLQAVAAQQLETDVRTALNEKVTDKAEAVKRYKGLLQRVEEDKNLADDHRAGLKRVLQDRIRFTETAVAEGAAKTRTQFAEGAAPKPVEKPAAETAKLKESFAAIEKLNQQGKSAEAQRQAQELLQKNPDNVAAQILNGISATAKSLEEAQAVAAETDHRRLLAMREVDKSAMPAVRDMEFPAFWRKLSDERLKRYGMSPEDKAILETLSAPIKVEFKSTRIQDVMDYMSKQMKRTIVLDKNALEEAQVNYDTPISCSFQTPVTTRTVLRAILNNVNLTYVIRDGVFHVTSRERAKDLMVTRTYYIGDLVTGLGMVTSPPQVGHPQDQAQLAQNVQVIIDMITQSVDPSSWKGQGGFGVVGYNIATQSLIVRQSAEVHNMIRGSLGR
jgi:hypothetical protein